LIERPVEEKIRDVEDGITPEFVGMVPDPFEVLRVIVKLLKSAKEEMLYFGGGERVMVVVREWKKKVIN